MPRRLYPKGLPTVEVVFREILNELLPPGCAILNVERKPDGEAYVRLLPTNPGAAPITARGGGVFQYDVVVGQGTLYEIIPEPAAFSGAAVEQLRSICQAVFSGQFEETIYTVGNTVAKTVGKVTIGGVTLTTHDWHHLYLLIPKKKRVVKYAPYY